MVIKMVSEYILAYEMNHLLGLASRTDIRITLPVSLLAWTSFCCACGIDLVSSTVTTLPSSTT